MGETLHADSILKLLGGTEILVRMAWGRILLYFLILSKGKSCCPLRPWGSWALLLLLSQEGTWASSWGLAAELRRLFKKWFESAMGGLASI